MTLLGSLENLTLNLNMTQCDGRPQLKEAEVLKCDGLVEDDNRKGPDGFLELMQSALCALVASNQVK